MLNRVERCAFGGAGVSLSFFLQGSAEEQAVAQVEARYCQHCPGGAMEVLPPPLSPPTQPTLAMPCLSRLRGRPQVITADEMSDVADLLDD